MKMQVINFFTFFYFLFFFFYMYFFVQVSNILFFFQIAERLTALAVNSFGKLDGVVINHGVLEPKRFADESIQDTKTFYDVNLFSYIAMVRHQTVSSIGWLLT